VASTLTAIGFCFISSLLDKPPPPPPVGQDLLIIEASRSHSYKTYSVRLLWSSDQLDAENSTCATYNIHKRKTFVSPVGFELAIPTSERPQTYALDQEASEMDAVQFSIESCIIITSITVFEKFTCMLCICILI
jgi:hypothetical protein